MKVTVPIPPRGLSPNSRVHWSRKATLTKKYRTECFLAASYAVNHGPEAMKPRPEWESATIWIFWFHRTKNRPDPDNAKATLKAAIDAIVDAGILADDKHVTYPPIEFSKDADNPRVEFEILETERCEQSSGSRRQDADD